MNSKKYFLFVGYVVLTLLIRQEFHPFSRFPMYDSFPNWAYVFYITNEHNEIVPYKKKFSINKDAGNIAHSFYMLFGNKNWYYGYGQEKPEHIKIAGKALIEKTIKNEDLSGLNFDTLKMYQRYYYLENDSIKYRDLLMYAERIKQ